MTIASGVAWANETVHSTANTSRKYERTVRCIVNIVVGVKRLVDK